MFSSDSIYQSTVAYGRFQGMISFVVCIVISAILFTVSWFIFSTRDQFTSSATGNVTVADCSQNNDRFDCRLSVTFKKQEDGNDSAADITTSNTASRYNIGDSIKIRYDPKSPTSATAAIRPFWWGMLFCAVGFLVFLGGFQSLWVTQNYEVAAAATGAASAINVAIPDAFSRHW